MIFLSHNSNDKDILTPLANILKEKYGEDNIFYDSWSILPGDSIIGKMNEGLEKCKFFFYFLSKNSADSKMVDLEWQSTLMRTSKEDIKFILVRLDDTAVPIVIKHLSWIDIYNTNFDNGVDEICNVIDGKSSFKSDTTTFQNLEVFVYPEGGQLIIEIQAKRHVEQNPDLIIATFDDINGLSCKIVDNFMSRIGNGRKKITDKTTGEIKDVNIFTIKDSKALTPGTSLKINISNPTLNISAIFIKDGIGYKAIPFRNNKPD